MVNIPLIAPLWKRSRSLTILVVSMAVTFPLNLLGILIDGHQIMGVSAWLKPAKFALSTAIFAASIAWLLPLVHSFPRQARWAARIIALCLAIEMVIIELQAARGVTSHFNFTTPLNAALFRMMAVAILVLALASSWICVLLYFQRFSDRALGWALRLGMTITVAGALSGGLMTRVTPAQRMTRVVGQRLKFVGAHTVGAPDGGKGLPVVNWSRSHGDLRIPHFLGLHGLQLIPLLYWFVIRRRTPMNSWSRLVIASSFSYAALIVLLGWQALRGQSIATPDTAMTISLATWAAASALLGISLRSRKFSEMEIAR